jgi:hypothetical protein
VHVRQRNVLIGAIVPKTARSFRGESEQRPERRRRAGAGLELEQLAKQRQRHDDGRCLEIHADPAVLAERIGEQPGARVAKTL